VSVRRQCQLLGLPRSSLYYTPVGESAEEIELMNRIDALHLQFPFYGSRKFTVVLCKEGLRVNRKRVQRLMRKMGIEAMVPKPDLSRPNVQHEKYPYLLRDLTIDRPNQVWATDITYIPMAVGFGYLVAIIDWYSRRVLSWRLSNTMDTRFCVEALHEALEKFGTPQIFNTDQGSQFTSKEFTQVLKDRGIAISMDGRGRWVDNVFIERLWRSLKVEEVYLHAYRSLLEARKGISAYFSFYNHERRIRLWATRHQLPFTTLLFEMQLNSTGYQQLASLPPNPPHFPAHGTSLSGWITGRITATKRTRP